MNNPMKYIYEKLETFIFEAMEKAINQGLITGEVNKNIQIEVPADSSHGDFACNVAMINAKNFKKSPRDIAEIIKNNIDDKEYISNIEIAGPGFINFKLNEKWFFEVVKSITENGEKYGQSNIGNGKKVIVEYVSANPTGPMHMGNARGGVLGDTLSTALKMSGYQVLKEFYVNDAGNQIMRFGASLEARYIQLHMGENVAEVPEDGYQGKDIIERVNQYSKIYGDKLIGKSSEEIRKSLVDFALPLNIEKLKNDLESYKVVYDNWFLESTLHKDGSIDRIIEKLKKSKHVYEKDGALWIKSTDFGLEKDDVIIRENGIPTYLVVDIAYHYNKFVKRGYDKGIDIWGADHHGHVERLKHAITLVGMNYDDLDIVLMQMVRLVRNGEVVRMSKRTGKAITLTDLIEEIPISAARFFFNLREPNMAYDFDLDLAVKEEKSNPVYYVQYTYPRINSIFKNLKATDGVEIRSVTDEELSLLSTVTERDLIKHLSMFPNIIKEIATTYDPSSVTRYATSLASKFHKFYETNRIKDQEDGLQQARLNLALSTKIVIKNILDMLKVDAPDVM